MKRTCPRGHTFDKTTDCPTCPVCEREAAARSGLPKVGAPATRALQGAGIGSLADLTGWTEKDLLSLHAMGPKAIAILRSSLHEEGLAFKGE
jgi:hypothetical protein